MRDGRLVTTRPAASWSKDSLVQTMLGDTSIERAVPRAAQKRPPMMSVQRLAVPDRVVDISFDLATGAC